MDFDHTIKLAFHGSTVTSDAGLLADRELDDALGLPRTAASRLRDTRTGQNTQQSVLALLRQSIYSHLAGYEDVNDAERLCLDPAMRIVIGGRAEHQTAASTSEMARFETETLSSKENLTHLMDLPGAGGFQGMSEREASCAPGSGHDGAATGGPSWGKSLHSIFRVGKLTVWSRGRGPRVGSSGKDRIIK
jgi:hypothetical protein